MSENNRVYDETIHHEHTCANCAEDFHCVCPDPDEVVHTPLCTDCFQEGAMEE
jgi:hypothetical protein